MSGPPVTGVGPGLAMYGHPGVGSCRRGKPLSGCRVIGRAEREAGCGSRATGSKLPRLGLRLSREWPRANDLDCERAWLRKGFHRAPDEKLTALLELERAVCIGLLTEQI
jgi:hypothetical protein